MPTYRYAGETPRVYPYPPIARRLEPGDTLDLEADQVPTDGRFTDSTGAVVRAPEPAPETKAAEPTGFVEVNAGGTVSAADAAAAKAAIKAVAAAATTTDPAEPPAADKEH